MVRGKPEPGKTYRLTGDKDTPSVMRGDPIERCEVFTVVCPECGKEYAPVLGKRPDRSQLIQEQFPNASPVEREQLLSGVCSQTCWDSMFGWPAEHE